MKPEDKKAVILLAEGFEEIEALTTVNFLRRAKIETQIWSTTKDKIVTGTQGISVQADFILNDNNLNAVDYDAIIIPGGWDGMNNLKEDYRVIELLQEFAKSNKLIAAICAGPMVLEEAGLTKGRIGTTYPGLEPNLSFSEIKDDIVVQDGNLITSRGPATTPFFALKIIATLKGEELADKVAKGALLPLITN